MFLLVLGLGCAFVCGVFAALILQWHFFLNYLMKLPAVPPFPNEEYARPRAAKVRPVILTLFEPRIFHAFCDRFVPDISFELRSPSLGEAKRKHIVIL